MLKKKITPLPLIQLDESMNDIKNMDGIFALTEGFLNTPYQSLDKIFQEATPKTHGCVEAVFQINSDIPIDLQQGVFSSLGKKYETVLQFFNNSENKEGQDNKQILIKVCDVGGAVIEEDNGNCNQDFFMTNNTDNPSNYDFISDSLFCFGSNLVAKFLIQPINRNDLFELSTHASSDDLLKNILYQNELVEFDFMVQVNKSGLEADSSFVKVAKLTFSAAQAAINLISEQDCCKTVFNPLHSLTVHQPLKD